jgi:hypothetical protein
LTALGLTAVAVAARFGLGSVTGCTPVTEGLMNPNWRLTTTAEVLRRWTALWPPN